MSAAITTGETATQERTAGKNWTFFHSGYFACIFFFIATAAFTWPLVAHMTNSLPDALDSADTTRQIAALAHNLLSQPLHLYDTQALYPLNNDLALNELLAGQDFYGAPIIWLTGNPIFAWNLLAFANYFLSGVAMWLLVRHAAKSSLAGLAAGTIYSFSPWHIGEYGHLAIATIQWMVFALFFLVLFMEHTATAARLLDRRGMLYLLAFTLFSLLQALAEGYYAYYEVILFGLYSAYYLVRNARVGNWAWAVLRRIRGIRVDWRRLGGQAGLLLVAGGLIVAALYPFIHPYSDAKAMYGFTRSVDEVEYWSAGPLSLLRTTTTSPLYAVEQTVFGLQTSIEREMYPGVIAVVLAFIGLFSRGRKRGRVGPGLFALIGVVGLLLSFGPVLHLDSYGMYDTGIPLPYMLLYKYVPGFDALRVPHRFDLLVMLGLGGCAGYGIVGVVEWCKQRRVIQPVAISGLCLALLLADFFAPGLPSISIGLGDEAPPLYRWLASVKANQIIPRDALLLELPMGQDKTAVTGNPQYLLYGLEHERPMLNGSPNIVPPGYDRLYSEMRRFPTPSTLDMVESLGVRYLIVHTGGLLSDQKRADLQSDAKPGGRLQVVVTFPDTNPDGTPAPNSQATVYRIVAAPQRFSQLKTLIPPGSTVLLTDHPSHLRLTTAVLPNLIGRDRRYYTTYSTIYSTIEGNTELAQAGKRYDFAVLYTGVDPGQYGYSAADLIYSDPDGIFEVYHRR